MSRPISSESVFQAIAHPARRRILDLLRSADQSVSAMREHSRLTLPAFSQHLRVLDAAGLVKHRRKGRYRVYSLQPRQLQSAWAWLAEYQRYWPRPDAKG